VTPGVKTQGPRGRLGRAQGSNISDFHDSHVAPLPLRGGVPLFPWHPDMPTCLRKIPDLPRRAAEAYFQRVITSVRLVRVLLILVLALLTVSFVISVGSSETGAAEKLVLLALIAGCIFVAARVSKFATRTQERLRRR